MGMTYEQFKEALAQKIASKEEFDDLLKKASVYNADLIGFPKDVAAGLNETYYLPFSSNFEPEPLSGLPAMGKVTMPSYSATNPYDKTPGNHIHHSRWWLARELLRIRYGVYPMTEPLVAALYGPLAPLTIHCAIGGDGDDPTLVAYTPDETAGEADKQVRTSLGKLVRKLFPHMRSDAIRDLEAAHRADLTNEIEVVHGADIAKFYRLGPSSCMSHPAKNWDGYGLGGRHPTEVYDAPGWGLALHRVGGEVNARCLVWVNPDDPKDKRWIRLYGDSVLMRKLNKAGYRNAGSVGALLKRIPLKETSTGYNRYLMAYIDNPSANSSLPFAGQYVLPYSDQYLRIVSSVEASAVQKKTGITAIAGATTQGYVQVDKRLERLATNTTCPITNQNLGSFGSEGVIMFVSGKPAAVHKSVPHSERAVNWYNSERGVVEAVHLREPRDTAAEPTFPHDGGLWFDDAETRAYCGYSRLHPEYYPDGGWGYSGSDAYIRSVHNGTPVLMLKADATMRISTGNTTYYDETTGTYRGLVSTLIHHKDEKKDDVVLARTGVAEVRLVAAADVKTVRTHISGRRVVPGLHRVLRTYDGKWDFSRNLTSTAVYGQTFYMVTTETYDTDVRTNPHAQATFELSVTQACNTYKSNIEAGVSRNKARRSLVQRVFNEIVGSMLRPYYAYRGEPGPVTYLMGSVNIPSVYDNSALAVSGMIDDLKLIEAAAHEVVRDERVHEDSLTLRAAYNVRSGYGLNLSQSDMQKQESLVLFAFALVRQQAPEALELTEAEAAAVEKALKLQAAAEVQIDEVEVDDAKTDEAKSVEPQQFVVAA